MTFVVAITGASSGTGRATAQAFAREGATVGLIARGPEALAATTREVECLGGRPVVLACDVADPQALDSVAERLEREGEIDVWVNNAIASVFAPTWEITAREFHRVTEVTYFGVVYGTLCAPARMRALAVLVVGSALTAGAILRVCGRVFAGWGRRLPRHHELLSAVSERPETLSPHDRTPAVMIAALALLLTGGILIGLWTTLRKQVATAAAALTDRAAYVTTVLGGHAPSGVRVPRASRW